MYCEGVFVSLCCLYVGMCNIFCFYFYVIIVCVPLLNDVKYYILYMNYSHNNPKNNEYINVGVYTSLFVAFTEYSTI
jgi:hypothetical protein